MTAITVERIKLFSTRSPYWCLLLIAVAGLGFAVIFALVESGSAATAWTSQRGTNLGMMIFMVLSALAITTEYRFGTIKSTFLAEPNRTVVLLAKTVMLAVLGAVVGLIIAVAGFYLTKALASNPTTPLGLDVGDSARVVFGQSAMFAVASVIAVSIGALVRQSAGAIAIVLLWPLLVESLLSVIPALNDASQWFPFAAGDRFVSSSQPVLGIDLPSTTTGPTPIQGLLVFIGTAVVLWIAALIVLRSRDA